jgi:putative CocE/NonD family hydrolase
LCIRRFPAAQLINDRILKRFPGETMPLKLHELISKYFRFLLALIVITGCSSSAQNQDSLYVVSHYTKSEFSIPMRDGAKLFTIVYAPKDTTKDYPILMTRTPYTVAPYGINNYRNDLGPGAGYKEEGFIFVYQDVRGQFMSEGTFVNMRPFNPDKKSPSDIDEASDSYDSIDWLIKNVAHNNGKVGVYGISYPGFYSIMAALSGHPNLVAVSPQAPIADWFACDDMHHNGAFSLLMSFDFFSVFGVPHDKPTTEWGAGPRFPAPDAYTFFLNLGPLKNANGKYLKGSIPFWDEMMQHDTKDEFWKLRRTLPYLKNLKPAILTVGGWYDSEDLYGTLNSFKTIEENGPKNFNSIVMGPWYHHEWSNDAGDSFGDIKFGSNTGDYFRDSVQFPFFLHYLKNKGTLDLPKALFFETGSNKWERFAEYPPKNTKEKKLYLANNRKLLFEGTTGSGPAFDEYLSDPAKPVPYTAKHMDARAFYYRYYMNEDQRFAAERPDVLVFETEPLTDDMTIVGSIAADLTVSTSGTDADWVVKLIDVFPDDAKNPSPNPNSIKMGGYQNLIRGEILRGKFRNSLEKPEPFVPNKPEKITVNLLEIDHTFLKGHKIMVQIQSSWFPFFDRNPQTFCSIPMADEKDFQKAFNRVYHSAEYPSFIELTVLK